MLMVWIDRYRNLPRHRQNEKKNERYLDMEEWRPISQRGKKKQDISMLMI